MFPRDPERIPSSSRRHACDAEDSFLPPTTNLSSLAEGKEHMPSEELLVLRPFSHSILRVLAVGIVRDGFAAQRVGDALEVTILGGGARLSLKAGEPSGHVDLGGQSVRFYLCLDGESSVQAAHDLRCGTKDLIRSLPDDFWDDRNE